MRLMTCALLALISVGLAQPAAADDAAAKVAAAHLEAGTLSAGESELSALLDKDAGNDEARMGLGTIRFIRAVERLSQGLYKYGLKPPSSFLIPIVRLPVP